MNFFNSFLIHKNLLDFSTNAQIPSWHWVFNLTASWLSQKFQAHLLREVYSLHKVLFGFHELFHQRAMKYHSKNISNIKERRRPVDFFLLKLIKKRKTIRIVPRTLQTKVKGEALAQQLYKACTRPHRQYSRPWFPWGLETCIILMCISYST